MSNLAREGGLGHSAHARQGRLGRRNSGMFCADGEIYISHEPEQLIDGEWTEATTVEFVDKNSRLSLR